MAKKQTAPYFSTFAELMETLVIPYYQANPNFEQLDGSSGTNGSAFAYFTHFSNKWRVNKDTHIDRLLAAWKLHQAGQEPFVEDVTEKSNKPCLRLNEELVPKYKYLYIYLAGAKE